MKKSRQRSTRNNALLVYLLAMAGMGAMLFLPAGTLDYWEAWAFLAILFIPMVVWLRYLLKRDPELLERRIRFREKEKREKALMRLGKLMFFASFLVPGLDRRFGWSGVPPWLVIAADSVILLSYAAIFLVFRENTYASRIVEVEKGQKVIRTGPYAVVRHPMYAATITMYLCFPIALGSYVGLIFWVPFFALILARIRDEEDVLQRRLKGYRGYMKEVRYRLIPRVW